MKGVPELAAIACICVLVAYILSRFTPLLLRLGRWFQLLFGEPEVQMNSSAGIVAAREVHHRYVLHGIDEDD